MQSCSVLRTYMQDRPTATYSMETPSCKTDFSARPTENSRHKTGKTTGCLAHLFTRSAHVAFICKCGMIWQSFGNGTTQLKETQLPCGSAFTAVTCQSADRRCHLQVAPPLSALSCRGSSSSSTDRKCPDNRGQGVRIPLLLGSHAGTIPQESLSTKRSPEIASHCGPIQRHAGEQQLARISSDIDQHLLTRADSHSAASI